MYHSVAEKTDGTMYMNIEANASLQCHHNGHNGVSNQRHLDCLLNRLLRRKSKKASKLYVTGICVRGFHSQRASNAEIFPFDDVIMYCSNNLVDIIKVSGLLQK